MDLPLPTTPDPDCATLIARRPHLAYGPAGLRLDGVDLAPIAEALGTPCWVYGADTMQARLRRLQAALSTSGLPTHVHFAVKANSNLAVLRCFAALGAGADVVSGGELLRARAAGIAGAGIVFSGVGKTVAELELALTEGVAQINVESAEELEMLSAVATRMGRVAPIALRVNPDVDAGTHAKITTGLAENKFGIALDQAPALYARAAGLPGIKPVGVAVHIGSQIGDVAPYRAAFAIVADLVRDLRAAGQCVDVVDCGGGLGIAYRDEDEAAPEEFARMLAEIWGGMGVRLAVEPGRWLVGPTGVLLTRVVLSKTGGTRRFMVLDAAMNDLARPAMYEAWHGIVPLHAGTADDVPQDIVGPVCETGDTFARARALPALADGALVAILDAGAYGAVMSSTYNSRPLAAEALIGQGQWSVIRPRQDVAALWQNECIPGWLGPAA